MSDDLPVLGHHVAKGFDPDPVATALLQGTVLDPMDLEGLGIEDRVAHYLDRFEQVAHARVIMKLARSAGISYSEAQHRWSNPEDLAAELAWDIRAQQVAERTCPDCGLDPALMVDDKGRRLARGVIKVAGFHCPACELMERAQRHKSDKDKDDTNPVYGPAYKLRFAHRADGEDLMDM